LTSESKTPARRRRAKTKTDNLAPEELEKLAVELEEEMLAAAEDLRFEYAARLRDELRDLRRDMTAMRSTA
jgi:excinuclease ABC subunit B